MENVKISKICGLCPGCSHAVNTALECIKNFNNVVLFKEIVHNKNVNNMLIEQGIKTTDNLSELESSNHVIIRAHGEPPETYEFLNSKNINFSDCTCRNVKNIHELVKLYSLTHKILIVGKYKKALHPEVYGTMGWCNNNYYLIEDQDDLDKLKNIKNENFYLVCQTTFNIQKAEMLIDEIKNIAIKNNCELVVNKSLCAAQSAINKASKELAKDSDVMIVIGGKNSSNSKELYNNLSIVTKTIFIEDINTWQEEFKANGISFSKDIKIGITAGASTLKSELVTLKNLIEEKLKEL